MPPDRYYPGHLAGMEKASIPEKKRLLGVDI